MSDKITAAHLGRCAYVYVRQSSQFQVQHNLESQRRQYGLADRARALGWKEVEVIDEDLGRSGGGTAERKGFERLVAAVSLGKVGAVLSLEASRLARNNRDWHQLVDLCGLTGTLLIDQDGVYSPQLVNDRLLLGLKGTMSEFELTLFRQRALEAIKEKAKRGELYSLLPIGYVHAADDRCEKDPDLRVQQAVRTVFEKFAELGTVRQVLLWFRQGGVLFPTREKGGPEGGGGRRVEWKLPVYGRFRAMLANPFYAGAYTYGRTGTDTQVIDGRARRQHGVRRSREEWLVLIRGHHEEYIAWEQYEGNLARILDNANMKGLFKVTGAARSGSSLLAGLVRCGQCGRKLHVAYPGRGEYVRYVCRWTISNSSGGRCTAIGGMRIEALVEEKLLEVLEPAGVEAALRAERDLRVEHDQRRGAKELALKAARYEAERAQRQYNAVEPENRIVACELERRWDTALARVETMERELAQQAPPSEEVCAEERRRLLELGGDVRRAWHDGRADAKLKKRIARAMIEEVIIDNVKDPEWIEVVIRWAGGQHTVERVSKFQRLVRRGQTGKDMVELVRGLAEVAPDKVIARVLNRLGRKTGEGHGWIRSHVTGFRHYHEIAVYDPEKQREKGLINMAQAAERLSISAMSVLRLIREGILHSRQVVAYAPRIIEEGELASPAVQAAVASIRRRAGIPLPETADQKVFGFQ